MYQHQEFQSAYKGGCGSMGRRGFGGPWGRGKFGNFWARQASRFGQPPVNIAETDTEYVISLYAAGLDKAKVSLSVKDDQLTVAYAGADQEANPASGYTYQEHSQPSFERIFQLNNKVLTDAIAASYADGILKVTLPKNPETTKPAQTITVG